MATEFQANEFTTTLVSSITSGDVTLTLASTVGTGINGAPSAPFRVRIEDEIILVGTRVGTLCSVLSRGEEATTAAFHAAGSEVRQVLTVAGLTDAIVSYAAPLTATFVTSTDQTSTLTNSRQVLAGTNITLDTSIAGDLTINATSSASSPGGLNTYVQFNDASTFGGDAGFLYAKGTDHVALGPGATLAATNWTLRIDEDFAPAGVLSQVKSLVYARSDYAPTAHQVGIIPALYGYYADLVSAGAFNIAQMDGMFINVEHAGTGTLARAKGIINEIVNSSSGTITLAAAYEAILSQGGAGAMTNAIGFYGQSPVISAGAITNAYGMKLEGVTGATTNHAIYTDQGGVRFGDHTALGSSNAIVATDDTLFVTENFSPAGNLSGNKLLGLFSSIYNPSVNQAGGGKLSGVVSSLNLSGSHNIAGVFGSQTLVSSTNTGTTSSIFGSYTQTTNTSSGTVTTLNNVYSEFSNDGTVTLGFGYYLDFANSGTLTTFVSYYSEELTSGTNRFYQWLDADGVYAIEESSNQAKASLYNSGIAKYTFGSANYERSILQWNTNVLEFGAQAGGTGTLRGMRLLGDRIEVPALSIVSGSNDVALDIAGAGTLNFSSTDAHLYLSATGTFDGDATGLDVTNASNVAGSYAYLAIYQGAAGELKGLFAFLEDGSPAFTLELNDAATEIRFAKHSAESIDLNLSTSNTATWSSATGVNLMTFTGMDLKPAGYKSSDGSSGVSGTATAANTLTIKNGLVTTIA